MQIKLNVLENYGNDKIVDPNTRLKVNISLDKMFLIIQKRNESTHLYSDMYSEEITVDLETEMDEVFDEFYKKFLKLRDIENYWKNALKDNEVIEFRMEEELGD